MLPWRNWLARSTVNRKVGGSNPPGSDLYEDKNRTKMNWIVVAKVMPLSPNKIATYLAQIKKDQKRSKNVRSRVGLNHQPFD